MLSCFGDRQGARRTEGEGGKCEQFYARLDFAEKHVLMLAVGLECFRKNLRAIVCQREPPG